MKKLFLDGTTIIVVWLLAIYSALPIASGSADKDFTHHPINQWVRQSPQPGKPAPPFGWEGSGSFDPWLGRWIHFGGHDGIPQGFPLFTFDLATGVWEQRFPNTSPPGCCCVDGANVFDPANRRFVRFPGAALGHGYQWSRGVKLKSSHVWLYEPVSNRWTNMRPPPYAPLIGREGLGSLNASATYDPKHELALSFGGQGSSGGTNNLFVYDAYANRLHRLPAEDPPSHRDGMGLAYDAKHDCLVMFGSQYDSDEKTWIYRYATGKWESHALDPHPVGKKLGTYSTIPRMAYDDLHEICLCIAWDTNTNEHQTWAFDAGKLRWTKLSPKTEPAPSMSRSRNLSFSSEHNLFILETSSKDGKGRAPEIWTYRYSNAIPEERPAVPIELKLVTDKYKATLTWSGGKAPVAEYHVYRAQAELPWKPKFEKIAAVKDSRFEDKDLADGKVYFYMVKAFDKSRRESKLSQRARTEPRVILEPVVSVTALDQVDVSWNKHPAPDVVGYNIYRGTALMRSVKKGTLAPWTDNDPEYAEPMPVDVRDIIDIRKLNDGPIVDTKFHDLSANLTKRAREPNEYKRHVLAYIVKAVNALGVESGPSPYAVTLPSAPTNVLCRERGTTAELKWDANPEKGIAGYHLYKLGKDRWEIVRITEQAIKATTISHEAGRNTTRYWVVAVDALGQEGEPSSPVWFNQSYKGFFAGDWHQ